VPDAVKGEAESPERRAIEELLSSFDPNLARLNDGGKKALTDFTERALADIQSAVFAPEDPSQAVFAREGLAWRIFAPEEGRAPVLAL
jgi:hypothetical protein